MNSAKLPTHWLSPGEQRKALEECTLQVRVGLCGCRCPTPPERGPPLHVNEKHPAFRSNDRQDAKPEALQLTSQKERRRPRYDQEVKLVP
eukprot:5910039-Amphidinium_carterae.1